MLEKLERLKEWFSDKESAAIAFSGGVDSSLLLKIAHLVLGDKVLALTIDSPLNTKEELENASQLAKIIGVRHIILSANELGIPKIKENNAERCYHCKKYRLQEIIKFCREEKINLLIEGSNFDDLQDYRPGLKAVKELGLQSPLQEVGLKKAEIRELAKLLNLPVWDRPSEPCLATRFPFGVELTADKLILIEKCEKYLKNVLNIDVVRVREHNGLARIEVREKDLEKIIKNREDVGKNFKNYGFRYITLDICGYRRGSMNFVGGSS